MRLLLIEDEKELAGLVREGLIQQGYDVDIAYTLADARCYLTSSDYDLIISDRTMPDGDSLELIRDLTSRNKVTQVLILSGCASYEDRVAGLNSGADDYLIKPFAMIELSARIRNLLRRSVGLRGYQLRAGNIVIDLTYNTVMVDEQLCKMTRRETVLLEALMRRMGRLVTKESLEKNMYGLDDEGSSGAIDIAMFRLRKTLKAHGANVQIHTMRGLGYVLEEPNDETQT